MPDKQQSAYLRDIIRAALVACVLAVGPGAPVTSGVAEAGVLPQDGDARYELLFWESIKDSERPEDYEAYLEAFPDGRFAPLAKARAAYLRGRSKTPRPDESPEVIEEGEGAERAAPTIEAMDARFLVIRTSNLRAEPTSESRILGTLTNGERLRVTGRVEGRNWYRVQTDAGVSGFVFGDLIREVAAQSEERRAPAARQAEPPAAAKASRPPRGARFDEFQDCPECPQMVALPAGSFIMGDNRGDYTEKPAHSVTIAQPFAIGKYEVTVTQWNACVLAGGCAESPDVAGTVPNLLPVRDVSWSDAQEFVKWLSAETGKPYRLPSESEWEYAARGGTKTRYWWGARFEKEKANCSDCGGDYDRKSPAKIGSFEPNAFGLHDMAGGVWEWVQDCWHRDYRGAPSDGSPWSKDYCRVRVLRGGSWRNDSSYVHSASRFKYDADVRYLVNGFRVAMTLN